MRKYSLLALFISGAITLGGCSFDSLSSTGGPVTPTETETTFCNSAADLILSSFELASYEASKDFDTVEANRVSMNELVILLEEESSPMSQGAEQFLLEMRPLLALMGLGTARFQHGQAFTEQVLMVNAPLESLSSNCASRGLTAISRELPLTVSDFYPDGFWAVATSAEALQYTQLSKESWVSVKNLDDLEIDENLLDKTEGGQLKGFDFADRNTLGADLRITCIVPDSSLQVRLDRINASMEFVVLGPSGKVNLYYSIDGGQQMKVAGEFANERLFPFWSRGTEPDTAAREFLRVVESGNETLSFRVDSPGHEFTVEFSLLGFSKVMQGLVSQGCLKK
jgi:hypothetical protein